MRPRRSLAVAHCSPGSVLDGETDGNRIGPEVLDTPDRRLLEHGRFLVLLLPYPVGDTLDDVGRRG